METRGKVGWGIANLLVILPFFLNSEIARLFPGRWFILVITAALILYLFLAARYLLDNIALTRKQSIYLPNGSLHVTTNIWPASVLVLTLLAFTTLNWRAAYLYFGFNEQSGRSEADQRLVDGLTTDRNAAITELGNLKTTFKS